MRRTRKGAPQVPKSQDIKSVMNDVRAAQNRARELLKKAGKNVREVRHDVSQLKKAGIVSKRVNARNYLPSRYMLKKIERNRDILSGEVIAVKAPKKVREKYREKGVYEERGSVLIVPREYANQRTRISRGLVEISRDLRLGEEVRLVLPFRATDMEDVANRLLTDPTLGGMKRPDELFGFRLFGHNMATIGFPDAESLAEYILARYQHLFRGKNKREGVKNFELFRFKARHSQLSEPPEGGKQYSPRKNRDRPERDHIVSKRRERDALRKQSERETESEAKRQQRLEEQKARSKRNRDARNMENLATKMKLGKL